MANNEVALKPLQILTPYCRGAERAKTRIHAIHDATLFDSAVQNKAIYRDGFSVSVRKMKLRLAQCNALPLAKGPFGG
jgi:hypothetical protein